MAVTCAVGMLVAMASCAPSAGAESVVGIRVSGGVTISWRGDPARGCVGACGASGSVTLRFDPGGGGALASLGPRGGVEPLFFLGSATGVARVRRDSGAPGFCVDRVDLEGLALAGSRPARRSRVAFDSLLGESVAGRCAGPMVADVAAALPSASVDARRLGRVGGTIRLGGTRAFAAEPFSGEVTSTLRLRVTPQRPDRGGSSQPGTPVPLTRVRDMEYRAVRWSGGVEVSFAGVPGPGCTLLDACGVTGQVGYTPDLAGASLDITYVGAGRHRRILDTYVDSGPGGTTTARLARSGAPDCVDAEVATPTFNSFMRRGSLRIALAPPGTEGSDVVRTRCPGPSESDVSNGAALAVAAVPTRAIGSPRLELRFRAGARFATFAYAGVRSVNLDVVLRRGALP